jgi:hypothetical protein
VATADHVPRLCRQRIARRNGQRATRTERRGTAPVSRPSRAFSATPNGPQTAAQPDGRPNPREPRSEPQTATQPARHRARPATADRPAHNHTSDRPATADTNPEPASDGRTLNPVRDPLDGPHTAPQPTRPPDGQPAPRTALRRPHDGPPQRRPNGPHDGPQHRPATADRPAHDRRNDPTEATGRTTEPRNPATRNHRNGAPTERGSWGL